MRSIFWCDKHAEKMLGCGVPDEWAAHSLHVASLNLYNKICEALKTQATIDSFQEYLTNSDTPLCCRVGDDCIDAAIASWQVHTGVVRLSS